MDTKTLVVGQDVSIRSGCYGGKGKVVRVTTSGVDVQTDWIGGGLFRFDNDGKGCDGKATYECGPWYVVGSPAEERETLREEAAARLFEQSAGLRSKKK
jgi:hypothetical protein